MADLPIELWHSIFDFLELTDLFSCALISKKCNFAVKEYRMLEITFTRLLYRWFHYTTPITSNYKHRADFTNASILERSSFNFDYLKRLKIGRSSAIDLNLINRFVRLEELDIDLKNYEKKKSRTLSLANLQLLYVFVPDRIPFVELDTPRLAKVCTFSLKKLKFIYPESVRCIHTFCHDGKLLTFRNLEYLIFTDDYNRLDYLPSYNFQSFEEFSLTTLEKLKEIDFYHYDFWYEEKNMEIFKRMTANLLALGRPDLKVFWLSVHVTDTNVLTEYKRLNGIVGTFVAFHLLHHEKLKEKTEFFWGCRFNHMTNKLTEAGFNLRGEEFLSKLLAKYSFRRIVITGKVKERELLMELIARSSNLLALKFSNSGLGQEFFDQMAETVRLNAIPLRWLQFENSAGVVLNFEFVTKLRDLERFETDQQLPNELVLLGLPMLSKSQFSSGWFRMMNQIERMSSIRYRLNERSLSLQKLLERFDVKSGLKGLLQFFCKLL